MAIDFKGNHLGPTSLGSFATVGDKLVQELDATPRIYLGVEVGEVCQLRCRHCIYHRPKVRSRKPNRAVLNEVSKAIAATFKPNWISFAGKEATLFPDDLLDTARLCVAEGRLSILMTNGLKLEGKLLDDLHPLIGLFDISIDGTQKAHDWMRGSGTFDKTWRNLLNLTQRYDNKVGLIATAVHGETVENRPQILDLIDLGKQLADSFSEDRLALAISLYYGSPDDKLRLNSEEISRLIVGLRDTKCKVRILFTSTYSHLWHEVADNIGIAPIPFLYDSETGLPVVQFGTVSIILFNLSSVPQLSIRLSNDGLVYLGCNHLYLGENAARHAIGDLEKDSLETIVEQLLSNTHGALKQFENFPLNCLRCQHLDTCNGGDRMAGVHFKNQAVDPYCSLLGN